MPIAGLPLERPINLSQLLEIGLRTKPHEPALVSFESRWTWRELDQASRRLGSHYLSLGLTPGDRVASLLPNRGALIVHYLACIRAGLVAIPLNYRYQAPEIDHALEVSGAAVIIAHVERDEDLTKSSLAGRLPLGRMRSALTTSGRRAWKNSWQPNQQASICPRRSPTHPYSSSSRRAARANRKV
jgi:long-chain acyl-CoA synthetase